MYKVILVDDERIVIEGLKRRIRWDSLGLEVIGVADNGLDALTIINETSPDIVITDITMPIMDGLKLVEHIHNRKKTIEVIILSGYDEFDYARKALKFGAAEYLLKPIMEVELEETLRKIVTVIERKKMEKHMMEELKDTDARNSIIIERHIWDDLLRGRKNRGNEVNKENPKFFNTYHNYRFCILAIEIDNYMQELYNTEKEQLATSSILDVVSEIIERDKTGILIELDEKSFAAVTFYPQNCTTAKIEKSVVLLVCKIRETVGRVSGHSVSIAISSIVDSTEEINVAYMGACEAIKYKFMRGKGMMINTKYIPKESGALKAALSNLGDDLSEASNKHDKEMVFKLIDRFSKTVKGKNDYRHEEVLAMCYKMAHILGNPVSGDVPTFERETNEIKLLELINSFEFIDQFSLWLKGYYADIFEGVSRKAKYSSIVSYMIDFIEENYSKEIVLDDLCQKLFLSANYLSTVFKNEVGFSFKSYLTHYRLENAKKLLRNPQYKIYMIADSVGYKSGEYLSRMFKKQYGITCLEYRDKNSYETESTKRSRDG